MTSWHDDYKKLDLLNGKISFILEDDEDMIEIHYRDGMLIDVGYIELLNAYFITVVTDDTAQGWKNPLEEIKVVDKTALVDKIQETIYKYRVKMNTKNVSKTKIAFFVLLLHLAYAALFAVFMWIAGLLEVPCDRDGIYVVFSGISIALLCLYPFAATGINATSVFFQFLALKNNESKIKNIAMLVTAILYEVAMLMCFAWFWEGAMGV